MRIPPNYEEMIKDIAISAGKHGFYLHNDELTDYSPLTPDRGHEFNVRIQLKRQNDDFLEDAPIPVTEKEEAEKLMTAGLNLLERANRVLREEAIKNQPIHSQAKPKPGMVMDPL